RRGVVVEVEARATGALERLDLTDEDAVHQRTRSLGGGRTVDTHLGGTGVTGRDLVAPRIEHAIPDVRTHEALVTCQLGFGEELLHPTATSSAASSPRLPGPATPPDAR